jgi:hypothetical protein
MKNSMLSNNQTTRKMNGTTGKINGTERKINGTERKINGTTGKINGTEREINGTFCDLNCKTTLFFNFNFLIMKKQIFYLITMTAIFSAVLVSCKKDDDNGGSTTIPGNKLAITVVNGSSHSSDIDDVKVSIYDNNYGREDELVSVDYGNGTSFTINLPETVASKYLSSFDNDEFGYGVKVSNKNARTAMVGIGAYKGTSPVDYLTYAKVINKNKEPFV